MLAVPYLKSGMVEHVGVAAGMAPQYPLPFRSFISTSDLWVEILNFGFSRPRSMPPVPNTLTHWLALYTNT
jgi:hypothetical protein